MWPGMKLVHGSRDILKVKDQLKDPTKMLETCWLLGCPITTTRKPGLEDYGLSKATKTELCIQALRQALTRQFLERRRGLDLVILCSLKTCIVQQKLKKKWSSSLTLLCYHGVYVTPVFFDSRFFLKLSRILTSPFTYFFVRSS